MLFSEVLSTGEKKKKEKLSLYKAKEVWLNNWIQEPLG